MLGRKTNGQRSSVENGTPTPWVTREPASGVIEVSLYIDRYLQPSVRKKYIKGSESSKKRRKVGDCFLFYRNPILSTPISTLSTQCQNQDTIGRGSTVRLHIVQLIFDFSIP